MIRRSPTFYPLIQQESRFNHIKVVLIKSRRFRVKRRSEVNQGGDDERSRGNESTLTPPLSPGGERVKVEGKV